ncbi:amidohydrolase family protein [Lentzea sp. JNUCC 0626]|uniref:amidohydrolase family protein n=1 Tax=Lentzea sp. JNUCC 0626 TaxID=3367513 RepID=UPI00374954E8
MTGAIDVHAHYVTPRLRAAMEAAGHAQPDGMPSIPEWSAESALRLMDSVGIRAQLLSVSSPGVNFGDPTLARAVNEEGAAIVAAHPDRFGLLASLPLPDPDAALAEVAHAFDELGADGLVLLTHYEGRHLGHECHEPLMAELDRRRAVVLLHPTSPWCDTGTGFPRPMLEFPFETTRAVTSLLLNGVLDRYPAIRFVVPHAGAALPALADRVAAFGGPDVLRHLRSLHYDLAGFALPRLLPALRTLTEPEHLLYGSDFPFTPEFAVRGLAAALAETGVPLDHAAALFPRFA